MQLKRLLDATTGGQANPAPKAPADGGERRGPAPFAQRPESQARPVDSARGTPPFAGRREGRDDGPGPMARGMREQPAPPGARDGQARPAPLVGRGGWAQGPQAQQGSPRGLMGRWQTFARSGPAGAGTQNAVSQVRQLLEQAKALISRAEQLLDQQGPRAQAGRGFAQTGPGMQRDGRGGPPALGGRGGFVPPMGRDGRMGQGSMRAPPSVDGWQRPQGPAPGGPMQRGPGQGQGFRGGFGPGGPGQAGPGQVGPGGWGPGPGFPGDGRFGPPRGDRN